MGDCKFVYGNNFDVKDGGDERLINYLFKWMGLRRGSWVGLA